MLPSKTKVSFRAGLVASVPIGESFSFRPELNFVQKGRKLAEEGTTDNTTLKYLKVPLNPVYNIPSVKGKFFIGAGPSLDIGPSGKEKNSEIGDADIKFRSGDNADFKSFEAAINFLAGYQFANGLFVAANYNTAINNIAPDDPSSIRNIIIGILG